jgi:DNA mismatch repair protein MutS
MSLIKEYFELTKKYIDEYGNTTLLLMQVGAFFEVYGFKDSTNQIIYDSNIMEFSRICDLNVVDKKVCVSNSEQVVMAGFKDHLLDKYIKKLQDNGFTIVVYVQDQQCANTTRSLLGIYSPGTYFSTDSEQITNNSACIWIDVSNRVLNKLLMDKQGIKTNNSLYVSVGMSVIDIYTGQTNIMEYTEQYIRNPTTFDELERFISIYNPSETILIYNVSNEEINEIVSYANIKSKSIHFVSLLEEKNSNKLFKIRALNCEKQKFQTELLNKFYKINDISSFMTSYNENVWGTQSFCYLLDFIYQHNPNLVYKLSEPIFQSNNSKLILANHSLKQLNIIDDNNYKGKYSSVVKMLNECVTTMGKRKFNHNFLNPLSLINKDILQKEYDITEYLLTRKELNSLRTMLGSLKDISKINRQILLCKVSPKSLFHLYTSLKLTKDIYNNIIDDSNIVSYLTNKVTNFNILITNIDEITEFLDNTLIIEECKNIENIQKVEESFIKLTYNKELQEKVKTLSDSIDQVECCRTYFNTLIASYESDNKKKVIRKRVTKKDDSKYINEVSDDVTETEYVKIYETEKNNYGLIATDRRCRVLLELLVNKQKSNQ